MHLLHKESKLTSDDQKVLNIIILGIILSYWNSKKSKLLCDFKIVWSLVEIPKKFHTPSLVAGLLSRLQPNFWTQPIYFLAT